MAYQLLYLEEVETDIKEAKLWYKEHSLGLENEFANAIENALYRIIDSPKAYAIRYKKIRIAHPKKFPYKIHFYIDEPNSIVVITAIVHSKRHAKIARKRD